MPLVITGEMFRLLAEKMMEAVELIPEEKRDFKIWEGSFKDKDGGEVTLSAMTPAELAADVVNAMTFFSALAGGEMELTDERFQQIRANRDVLATKPLCEIAALGREKAKKAASQLDRLPPEQLDKIVRGTRGPMPAGVMAMLEFGHLIHHRGQLYQVLRALGVAPPGFL